MLPWRERYENLTGKGGREAVAAPGRTATLNGLEWRLEGVTEGRVQEKFARPLPPRTRVAVVVTSVRPLTAAASRWFAQDGGAQCKFAVVDRAGRRWEPSFRSDLAPKTDHAASCFRLDAEYKLQPVPVGQKLTIQNAYVVPADAFPTLRVEVRLRPDPGTVRLLR
ncbi:hypothetical protein Sru01_26300 [Sphaerisporangium rufum]|uniref:Uncharacterized protein n=1 Tax=Sphaerisporangium rufum TaxID=1381558 RepID=A0A919R243_9ACTN|nr:hypothetical protein Sru01_26300 [Sphaerisporangium rufum]